MVLATPLILPAAALAALAPAPTPADAALPQTPMAMAALQDDAQPTPGDDATDDATESSATDEADEATTEDSVTARADQASADNPQVLMRGDTGTLVAWWQDRLNDWLVLSDRDDQTIAVDGIYGPNTETATRTFQDTNDTVETDGIVDPIDRVALRDAIDALESDDTGENGATDRTLTRGDAGTLVAWWQDRLNDWLALSGRDDQTIAVDGIYGPNTETATRTFQDTNDTVETDGIVDPIDRVALRDAIDALETGAG
ncbi:MAG: peptidoglycan-binding domain-containing protein [Acidimicrobiales bacterium]